MDVLATYRTSILSKELYVLRNANTYDLNVIDNAYPMTYKNTTSKTSYNNDTPVTVIDNKTGQSSSISNYFSSTYKNGYYYVKIIDDTADTGTNIYCFHYISFSAFLSSLFTVDYTSEFGDIATGVSRGIANIFQYIVEAYWMPAKPPHIALSSGTVKIGTYSISSSAVAKVTPEDNIEIQFSMPIPTHPQSSRGEYLNKAPYSTRKLEFYPFGVYNIDDNALRSTDTSLSIFIDIDINTGEGILTGYAGRSGETHGLVLIKDVKDYKVTIPLTESSISLIGGLGGVLGHAGFTETEKNAMIQSDINRGGLNASLGQAVDKVFIGIANGIGAIGSAIAQSGTEISHSGTLGNFSVFHRIPSIESVFFYICDEDIDHKGRPLCKNKVLNTLTGFTICGDNDIGLTDASQDQLDMIKEYLITGFFIE